MTPSVRTLQQKLVRKRAAFSKAYNKHYAEVKEILEALKGKCDHSQVKDYTYTWSNGFGRHDTLTAKECVFCGWKTSHGSRHFSDPATWKSQWDDD